MAKVKVKSVFLDRELVTLLYGSALGMGQLAKDKRRAINRLIHSFESHEKFDPEVEAGVCDQCGNMRLHFKLAKEERGVFIPIRREDRKPLYDVIVEQTLDRTPPKNMVRKLQAVAEALGYLKMFNDREDIQKDMEDVAEVEYEEVEDWEDEETPEGIIEGEGFEPKDEEKKDAETAESGTD